MPPWTRRQPHRCRLGGASVVVEDAVEGRTVGNVSRPAPLRSGKGPKWDGTADEVRPSAKGGPCRPLGEDGVWGRAPVQRARGTEGRLDVGVDVVHGRSRMARLSGRRSVPKSNHGVATDGQKRASQLEMSTAPGRHVRPLGVHASCGCRGSWHVSSEPLRSVGAAVMSSRLKGHGAVRPRPRWPLVAPGRR